MITTVKYTFPKGLRIWEVEAYIPLLASALNDVNVADIISNIQKVDYTIELASKLEKLKTAVRKIGFENAYRSDDIYVTTNRDEVARLRRDTTNALFKAQGIMNDVNLCLSKELFEFKYGTALELNTQTKYLNMYSQKVDPAAQMQAKLAVDNLKALKHYFDSLEASSITKTIGFAANVLQELKPTLSVGSEVFDPENTKDVTWLEATVF